MFNAIKALFAWKIAYTTGVYRYMENSVTKERKAVRVNKGGYQPIDWEWLNAGSKEGVVHDPFNGDQMVSR